MCEYVPAISVLLPVYNGAPYLAEAIESILNQTWNDFELIIINDGSKDESASIVNSYTDPRIRFFEQENQGLAASLNRAISLARGDYLARQDADDISLPTRLEYQIKYMLTHPECALLGTWAEIWAERVRSGRNHLHSCDSPVIKVELLFTNPFVHSSVLMRRSCLANVGGYTVDPLRQPPEDYELWSRIAREHDVANLPEMLVIYREVSGSLSRITDRKFWMCAATISKENIQSVLGLEYDTALIYGAVCLFHGVDQSSEQIKTNDLVKLTRDLALALETRYPESRKELRARLKKFFNIMLHRLYAHHVGANSAKYLVLLRSAWLFH